MSRRVFKFVLKSLKEISFVGTRYYPVDIDPNLSPYTTVLATIWDDDHMVGQINQTELLAWWSEAYTEPKTRQLGSGSLAAQEEDAQPASDESLQPSAHAVSRKDVDTGIPL